MTTRPNGICADDPHERPGVHRRPGSARRLSMRRPAMTWRVSLKSWSADHTASVEELTMRQITIAALGLAAAASASVMTQPPDASDRVPMIATAGQVVPAGAYPNPWVACP